MHQVFDVSCIRFLFLAHLRLQSHQVSLLYIYSHGPGSLSGLVVCICLSSFHIVSNIIYSKTLGQSKPLWILHE